MERRKATDFPQELLNLFDRYVHGDIGRREFLDGAKKFAVGGLTATAIWESLRPNYAWAQQVAKDDGRIKTESVTVPRHRAMEAYVGTWSVLQTPVESYPGCWSCTRIEA